MRLLDTYTGQFVEKDPQNTEYAILSHTWNHEGEQTYDDLRHIQARLFPATHSTQSPPSHPDEGPSLSDLGEPLDGLARSVASKPTPNEHTPLLSVPISPDPTTEQGLPSGFHHSRFRQLQRHALRPFRWVLRFATVLTCGCRRRRAELMINDHSPHPASTLSTTSSTDVGVRPPGPRHRSPKPCGAGEMFADDEDEALSSLWDDPQLSPKIRDACAVARADGFRFLWIDTCCIDRSSGPERSQAVVSMYSWYAGAAVCYAHLADVPVDPQADHATQGSRFRGSRWFARGWTLPELVAPRDVVFLSQDWRVLGSKSGLASVVEEITGVSREAFLHVKPLDGFSVAQRLAWASQRETMLVEDEAYALLGIFGVAMPIRYGEGEPAFRRLQEEIMQRVPDQSIFAWGDVYVGSDLGTLERPKTPALAASGAIESEKQSFLCCAYDNHNYRSLLATSPSTVEGSARSIRPASRDVLRRLGLSHPDTFKCAPSPHGFRTQFQTIPLSRYFSPHSMCYNFPEMAHWRWYLAILTCEHGDRPGSLLGRVCYILPSDEPGLEFLHPGYVHVSPRPERSKGSLDLFPLSQETIERCRPYIETRSVYI